MKFKAKEIVFTALFVWCLALLVYFLGTDQPTDPMGQFLRTTGMSLFNLVMGIWFVTGRTKLPDDPILRFRWRSERFFGFALIVLFVLQLIFSLSWLVKSS